MASLTPVVGNLAFGFVSIGDGSAIEESGRIAGRLFHHQSGNSAAHDQRIPRSLSGRLGSRECPSSWSAGKWRSVIILFMLALPSAFFIYKKPPKAEIAL